MIHGDQFDGIVRYARWLAILRDWAYAATLRLNRFFNWGHRKLGLPYWSLSEFLKYRVKNAVHFIADYERAVASEARRRGVDGVVCGHIHHAEMRMIDGILYCNDGDWVESCTADCFVFPSVTDTFGLVMVEALASGVPVAGYPVPGPLDVVTDPKVGALDEDLRTACLAAVLRDPGGCRRHAETFTWERCTRQFPEALQVIPRSQWRPLRNRVLPDAAAP